METCEIYPEIVTLGVLKDACYIFISVVRNIIYVSLKNFSLRDVTWKKLIKNLTYISLL